MANVRQDVQANWQVILSSALQLPIVTTAAD